MDHQTRLRSLLHALGDGGMTHHAENALAWMATTIPGTIPITDIGGLAEVAAMLGRPRQTVQNWITRGDHSTPKPIAQLAATALYDLEQWRVWMAGNPDLVKPGKPDG